MGDLDLDALAALADQLDLSTTRVRAAIAARRAEEEFCCPITCVRMIDPVVCAEGHTYEREAIARWLEDNDTSPKTREVLQHKNLTPNIALRQAIDHFTSS
mmetsp:Transcript_2619/g.7808  ORF Transcript_2619/g.7808 Transcript_2619/m.7808 type:complete len:101 (+) Transcript_2619:467-769(+)